VTIESHHNDIHVRAYTCSLEHRESKDRHLQQAEAKWSDFALIFDCESRITTDQSLTFGFWRFCELRDGRYAALEEGIFYDEGLTPKEIEPVRDIARSRKADVEDDGCDRIRVYSRSKFITHVLGLAIQAKAFIVCFNAGFDLSRIAVDWETAKNGGWSLILSQWRNPSTGILKANKFFPRVVIKALNSKTSIIHSTRAPMSEPRKKGDKVKLWPAARCAT
jgi:hypothetical protein